MKRVFFSFCLSFLCVCVCADAGPADGAQRVGERAAARAAAAAAAAASAAATPPPPSPAGAAAATSAVRDALLVSLFLPLLTLKHRKEYEKSLIILTQM